MRLNNPPVLAYREDVDKNMFPRHRRSISPGFPRPLSAWPPPRPGYPRLLWRKLSSALDFEHKEIAMTVLELALK